MKKILAFLPFFVLFFSSADAGVYSLGNYGGWSPYFSADAGLNYVNTKVFGYDVNGIGVIADFTVGLRKDKVRLSLSYQKQENLTASFSDVDIKLKQDYFLLSAYYNLFSTRFLSGVVGASAGLNHYSAFAENTTTGLQKSESNQSFTGGLYAGLGLKLGVVGFDAGVYGYYTAKPESFSFMPRAGFRIGF